MARRMSFQQIIGQEHAVAMLQNSLRNRRLSHAYLFSGPAGTGKRRTAECFIQAIYCTEREDDACGQCAECRKVAHGNHPGVRIIEPDGQWIKIEQIRNLQKDFAYRSSGNQPRVYMIVHADRMTAEAANSLLKFLEEPSDDVVAILISDNGQAVLPTLKSRSMPVPFAPLAPQRILEALVREGCPEHLARPASHIVSGLDAARELVQSNWFAELRNEMIQLMKECFTHPAKASLAIQQYMKKDEGSDHTDILLDLLMLWFKDMIHILTGRRERLVYADQADWLAGQALTRDVSHWIACMETVLETRKRLRTPVSPQLLLEQCLFRLIRQGTDPRGALA